MSDDESYQKYSDGKEVIFNKSRKMVDLTFENKRYSKVANDGIRVFIENKGFQSTGIPTYNHDKEINTIEKRIL